MNYPKSRGFLMKNDRKETENHPDAKGSLELTAEQLDVLNQMVSDGVEPKIQLAAWRETSKAGEPYTSIKAEAYYDPDKAPKAKGPRQPTACADDFPF